MAPLGGTAYGSRPHRWPMGGAAMTVLLDTSTLPARDRADAIRDTVAQTFVHVEINFATDGGPAAAVGAVTDFGQLTIFSVRSNHFSAERTPQLARDDLRPSIFFGLQLAGESLVAQGGRHAVVRPGELVIFDSTRPYVLTFPDGVRQHFFRIPLDRLALPHDAIRRVSALTLSPGHPVTDVAATYFRRLGSRPDLFTVPGADVLSEPSIELMRAVITTHLDAAELGKDALKATLPLRILEYARAHLHDPHLGAAQVAAAHHISERHLYNILGASGITWPTGSENSASNAAATTSPRRPFTPPRSHRSHADGDSPIPQALPACSKTPTACRRANGATKPTLGDPSPCPRSRNSPGVAVT